MTHLLRASLATAIAGLLVLALARATNAQAALVFENTNPVDHIWVMETQPDRPITALSFSVAAVDTPATLALTRLGGDIHFDNPDNVEQIALYRDVDSDGVADPAELAELPLDTSSLGDGTWKIDLQLNGVQLLPDGAPVFLLLVVDLRDDPDGYDPAGDMLHITIEPDTIDFDFVGAPGVIDVDLVNLPMTGNLITIYPVSPAWGGVEVLPDEDSNAAIDSVHVVVRFRVTADLAESMAQGYGDGDVPPPPSLDEVHISASGSGNDASDVHLTHLVHDANGNGLQDDTEPSLDAEGFDEDDGTIVLRAMTSDGVQLPWDTPVDLLIVYDFSVNVDPGETFSASLVAVTGVEPIVIEGTPLTGPTVTIVDTTPTQIDLELIDAEPQSAVPGQQMVVLGWLRLTGIGYTSMVNSITLQATGSAASAVIEAVHVVHDIDKNGNADGVSAPGGDGIVATTFDLATPETLPLMVSVSNGTSTDLLLAVDVRTDAPIGGSAGLEVIALNATGTLLFSLPVVTPEVTVVAVDGNDDEEESLEIPPGITAGTDGGLGCVAHGARTMTAGLLLPVLVLLALATVRYRRRQ